MDMLDARVRQAASDVAGAHEAARAGARRAIPTSRALLYAQRRKSLQEPGDNEQAIALLDEAVRSSIRAIRGSTALQAKIVRGARQAAAAAPGAGRGLCAAGQPARRDRAAAARPRRGRRRLLPALGGRRAAEGAARAARRRGQALGLQALAALALAAARSTPRREDRRSSPPRRAARRRSARAAHRALQQRLHAGRLRHRRCRRSRGSGRCCRSWRAPGSAPSCSWREHLLVGDARVARGEMRAFEAEADRVRRRLARRLLEPQQRRLRVDEAPHQPGAGQPVGPERLARHPGAPAAASRPCRARLRRLGEMQLASSRCVGVRERLLRARCAPASGRSRARRWPRTRGAACAARARCALGSVWPNPTRRLSHGLDQLLVARRAVEEPLECLVLRLRGRRNAQHMRGPALLPIYSASASSDWRLAGVSGRR